ncbi:MAG: UDP-N-acetylglucosamine 1-carboxyvinyltransferase [Candidatus Yanofskybacteria bacterium]|nr:UDP-N-acetylglucosamine 1-carboxyvinyltransferase [Candidatus Yanofskybacteria bacterium]
MSNLKIAGKTKLSGSVAVSGNKNAALPCLAASLLLPPSYLREHPSLFISNLPDIRDVWVFSNILESWGIKVNRIDKNTVELSKTLRFTEGPVEKSIAPEEARKLRASVLLLGPLLRQQERVVLPQPGGCKIGPRPIDTHLELFRDLGMDVKQNEDGSFVIKRNTEQEKLANGDIWLREASVTVTENALLFAAGNTQKDLRIQNAACEPHVTTLCRVLNAMGAHIEGVGSNLLFIRAGSSLFVSKNSTIMDRLEPDYIEALTFAVAAAVTKSEVTIKEILPWHLALIDKYLRLMGLKTLFKTEKYGGNWSVMGNSVLKISPELKEVKAEPWYGLPTDALPLLLILATQCQGELEFVDYMYNGRLTNLANSLNNMGADIKLLGNRGLLVKGPTPLKSRVHLSPDLRNGVGLVLAALCAEGESQIQNFEIIERGYENLPEKLTALDAKVEVI